MFPNSPHSSPNNIELKHRAVRMVDEMNDTELLDFEKGLKWNRDNLPSNKKDFEVELEKVHIEMIRRGILSVH